MEIPSSNWLQLLLDGVKRLHLLLEDCTNVLHVELYTSKMHHITILLWGRLGDTLFLGGIVVTSPYV
jgi:hypothetical protein